MAKKKENFTVISTGSWVPPDLDKQSLEKKSYKIFINDLQIKTLIGIHEHEKKKKQKGTKRRKQRYLKFYVNIFPKRTFLPFLYRYKIFYKKTEQF